MLNSFNSISALEVTAMNTSLKLYIELDKDLKEKIESHYGEECAFKLIVQTVLNLVDFDRVDSKNT